MYNECRHIFTSGRKCQSPALTDQNFCYFHSNTRKRPTPRTQPYEPYIEPQANVLDLPPLEDADSIQLALSDVILALAANRIDPRRARILIYGLQVASQNNRHRHALAEKEAEQEVQTMVRETHRHEDGSIIGPTKQTPDPEEAAEQKRPPSLGEILLREAEALRLRKEEEARLKAAEEAATSAQLSLNLSQVGDATVRSLHSSLEIQAVAETLARSLHKRKQPCRTLSSPIMDAEVEGQGPAHANRALPCSLRGKAAGVQQAIQGRATDS
jgi:hypothetical protein